MSRVTDIQVRKAPVQERSRNRVENILKSAEELLIDHGYAELRVSDVAKRAGVPIGSVYQYFGSKAAIYRMLTERYLDDLNAKLGEELERYNGEPTVEGMADCLVECLYRFSKIRPAFVPLWITGQSDKVLREMDVADSKTTSASLAAVLVNVMPESDEERVKNMVFLVSDLSGRFLSLLFHDPSLDHDLYLVEYKKLVSAYLKTT